MEQRGLITNTDDGYRLLEHGWRILWTYTEMLERDPILLRLVELHRYAIAVRDAAAQQGDRADILAHGRAYIGGALTTVRHLNHVTTDDLAAWCQHIESILLPGE